MDAAEPTRSPAVRRYEAMRVVRRHALYVAAASAAWQTPCWALSSPVVTVLQLKMLAALAGHYHVPFSSAKIKPVLASLAGGFLNYTVSRLPLFTVAKAWLTVVPVIGIPLRVASGPAILAGYTYVLGRAVTRHLEAGGNLDDVDLASFRNEALRLLATRAA